LTIEPAKGGSFGASMTVFGAGSGGFGAGDAACAARRAGIETRTNSRKNVDLMVSEL
jgi:hypothetical protein